MNPLEAFLLDVRDIRASGAGDPEISYYGALERLFNEVGKTLKPKVRCVISLSNRGAGKPDGGLFTAEQLQKTGGEDAMAGQMPARGAVEVKAPSDDVEAVARTEQIRRYGGKYGLVLVTNYRDFLLLGSDSNGCPLPMERFVLAESEGAFWSAAEHPQKTAKESGERLCEYLKRVMLSVAPLSAPQDLAWFLASYARDARARVEQHGDLSALGAIRSGLEEALGMKFEKEPGEHFFRSTLVQTLFYGVFSAWVLWHRERPNRTDAFDWRVAEWSLRVPFIRTLYHQVASADRLGPLGLVEVLEWAAGALNRVNRDVFFREFQDEQAVQYFYEPFLEAFDPELRRELGVWYTPPEIVQFQVARVDTVLREELGLADGLADPNVVILDPCCGTGAYLVEVLKRIGETLRAKGGGALIAADLKKAAMTRVFGFEILPAPFVISHLQLGLMLHRLGAPLSAATNERVGVYLTNSLTGWEPPGGPKQHILPMPELEQERDAADGVKRETRILVVLGNPPYNAFAGVSPEEEQGLVTPYKAGLNKPVAQGGWGIRKFNLDDLYIRFFRLAERRIAEMTGRGVVSFISNHSWIAEPSFVVLRKHLLGNFDRFWIENLHGNRKISEYAPDGGTSETIFAIRGFSAGIQQGVATSLWVKTGEPGRKGQAPVVLFRDDVYAAKAEERRRQLLGTLGTRRFNAGYVRAKPRPENRYSFRPESVSAAYLAWPRLPDLCQTEPGNGLMEKRGGALIDIDKAALERRMRDYFSRALSWEDYKARQTALTTRRGRFDPAGVRKKALAAERYDPARVRRYAVRPFDARWCYYTGVRPVWNEPRPALWEQCFEGNAFLLCRPAGVAIPEGVPVCFTSLLGDNDFQRGHSYYFPIRLPPPKRKAARENGLYDEEATPAASANLSPRARAYLATLCIKDPDASVELAGLIWMHALAIGYSPLYLRENADGIRRDWPRIPLPSSRKVLEASADLGRQVAALLDIEAEVPGVTAGRPEPVFRSMGVLSKLGGGAVNPDAGDLAVTAGWGHAGKGGVTMPGKGSIVQRGFEPAELDAIAKAAEARGLSPEAAMSLLGAETRDVYLNERVYWKNVPAGVWEYYIGGYQVVKKWLSYREHGLLGRALHPEEAHEVENMVRRLAAIVLLQPALDGDYRAVKANAYEWPSEAH